MSFGGRLGQEKRKTDQELCFGRRAQRSSRMNEHDSKLFGVQVQVQVSFLTLIVSSVAFMNQCSRSDEK